MNPESMIFLRVSEAVVSAVPSEPQTVREIQFQVSEGDMVGFCFGVGTVLLCQWIGRWVRRSRVASEVATFAPVKIADLDERETMVLPRVVLTPVDRLHSLGMKSSCDLSYVDCDVSLTDCG